MHPNPAYRQLPADRNLAFAAGRGFGTLAVNGPDGPLVSHVPFLLTADGESAECHLVRSNPILRALEVPLPAVLAVTGPDAYVSPDWYEMDHQVPTWNYVAVHLRGQLQALPPEALAAHLDRLSDRFEGRLAPKRPWKTAKMPRDLMERMMRSICPVQLRVTGIDGTWKLSQNKPEAARRGAAAALAPGMPGQEIAALAALMRDPPG